MAYFSRFRVNRQLTFLWTLLPCFGCGSGDDYAPATRKGDTATVAAFEGKWLADSPDGEVSFQVCEDPSPDIERWRTTCEVKHVVRGGGLSSDEDVQLENTGWGCGGCDYEMSAFFHGTLHQPSAEPVDIHGTLIVATSNEPEPYDGIYEFVMFAPNGVVLNAEVQDDTIPNATLLSDSSTYANSPAPSVPKTLMGLTFRRVEGSNCPAAR